MPKNRMIVTGSSGLLGSEIVTYFASLDWEVHGIDNNMRSVFFGPRGDTTWNLRRLVEAHSQFTHHEVDIRDRAAVDAIVDSVRPDAVVHCAGQPSHDLAARIPFDDFDVNATGTLNILEATRRHARDAVFVFSSTNKVYGDAPNELALVELPTRWEYAEPDQWDGIDESMRIDSSKHSLFGASKVAADVMVQEYGRYFGMKTCALRCGCITGPNHSGVELHGFLSHLVRANLVGAKYTIFGYKGKQVRDNIHAYDIARLVDEFIAEPRVGEVYNIGGGRANSCSILEAFSLVSEMTGREMIHEYSDQNREGDHICYISNLGKAMTHFPGWKITKSLGDTVGEIVESWNARLEKPDEASAMGN